MTFETQFTATERNRKNSTRTSEHDVFQHENPSIGEICGGRSLMALPFFALSKETWMRPLSYHQGSVSIEISPSASGVATIYDKEIVLYTAGFLAAKIEAGEHVSQDLTFTVHDLFDVIGPGNSACSYSKLSEALERLQGTQIKTNVESGDEVEESTFSWLSEAQLVYSKTEIGEKRCKAVKVRLCQWLHRAILCDPQLLNYVAIYCSLKPLERRIYEIAYASVGAGVAEDVGSGQAKQEQIELDLASFRLQIGYQNPLSNFRAALEGIVGTDTIPGCDVTLVDCEDRTESRGLIAAETDLRERDTASVRVVITRNL